MPSGARSAPAATCARCRELAGTTDAPGRTITALADVIHDGHRALRESAKPIVAAVQGPVAGGGLGFMLVADLIVASDRATFASRYSDVGLTPDCGVSTLLPEAVGMRRALELTLTSRTLTRRRGARLGTRHRGRRPRVARRPRPRDRRARGWPGRPAAFGQAKRLVRSGPTRELPGGARRRGPHDRRRVRDARRAGGRRRVRVGLGPPRPPRLTHRLGDPRRPTARTLDAALRSQQTPTRPRRTRPRAVPGARRPRWLRRARAR